MAKFVIMYTGGSGMSADPQEQQKIMAEWGAWYGQVGPAIVDGGAPFGASAHITAQGAGQGPLGDHPATGYTIVEAADLPAATAMCSNHPHINHGGQVQIFQAIDMGNN